MSEQQRLELGRRDLQGVDLDELLEPVDDDDVAVRLDAPEADDPSLASTWTLDAATDWIWAHIQPSAFAHLVGERGWSAEGHAERTVASLLREVVAAGRAPLRSAVAIEEG